MRLTPVRRAVLSILGKSPFALSGAEIEVQLPVPSDRITLYRTLRTFEEKGLVHRVVDHSDTVRYAASGGVAAGLSSAASAPHVHFKCMACLRIYCLPQVPVPVLHLPGYHHAERGDYLVSGVCERCRPE